MKKRATALSWLRQISAQIVAIQSQMGEPLPNFFQRQSLHFFAILYDGGIFIYFDKVREWTDGFLGSGSVWPNGIELLHFPLSFICGGNIPILAGAGPSWGYCLLHHMETTLPRDRGRASASKLSLLLAHWEIGHYWPKFTKSLSKKLSSLLRWSRMVAKAFPPITGFKHNPW